MQKENTRTYIIPYETTYLIQRAAYRDPSLRPSDKIVFSILLIHSGKKGRVFPKYRTLAQESALNVDTIRDCMKHLEDEGYIERIAHYRDDGSQTSNYICFPSKDEYILPTHEEDTENDPTPLGENTPPPLGENTPGGWGKSPYPIKDKYKNNNLSVIAEKKEYGNKEVGIILNQLKERLQLPMLDGTDQENRRYAHLCLNKFKGDKGSGLDATLALIDALTISPFWKDKVTSVKKLYYNALAIYQDAKKGGVKRGNEFDNL